MDKENHNSTSEKLTIIEDTLPEAYEVIKKIIDLLENNDNEIKENERDYEISKE